MTNSPIRVGSVPAGAGTPGVGSVSVLSRARFVAGTVGSLSVDSLIGCPGRPLYLTGEGDRRGLTSPKRQRGQTPDPSLALRARHRLVLDNACACYFRTSVTPPGWRVRGARVEGCARCRRRRRAP